MPNVLALKIETLRDLTPEEAQAVNGGRAVPGAPMPVSSAAPPHHGGVTAPVSSALPPHGRRHRR